MGRLFQQKDFISHAGKEMKWKIECDELLWSELQTLASIAKEKELIPSSNRKIIGIPTGGLNFAFILRQWFLPTEKESDPLLLVDDVYTTGSSLREARGVRENVRGLVIFAREPVKEDWIKAIWNIGE